MKPIIAHEQTKEARVSRSLTRIVEMKRRTFIEDKQVPVSFKILSADRRDEASAVAAVAALSGVFQDPQRGS